ncbi:hypothetical protein [uncultured Jatrophihabitans sp.]|uniref:hypothetical protein n=1 Tax=uncultured Jatrophihabitans sp. TaxID=1610747 RepID=UPI0035CAF4A7
MTAPVVQVEHGRHSTYFAGDSGVIHAVLKTLGCPRQYDRKRRALAVPKQFGNDVEAALEMQFGVDVQQVEAIS